jgi:hypothetical protein
MSLIDPSVSGLAAAGLPGSLFSFGTPCLKWKLVGAFKTHWGYTGFDGSISPPNRYLTKTIVYTAIGTGPGGTSESTSTTVFNIDRFSGAVTSIPPGALDIENLPTPAPVTYNGDTIATADTGVQIPAPGYTSRQIFQVTLSNQYTMAELEGDVDALIAGFDPATVGNQTFTGLAYPADPNPEGGVLATQAIGSPYNYPYGNTGAPAYQPTLGAAAIAAYAPATQFLQSFNSAGFGKIVSFLAMAGDYCLKTYALAPDATDKGEHFVGPPTCVSGRGSCASWFEVTPPTPFVPNENTYVLAVPNCQCGS